ncbi:MAG: alpha-ketoacid dehydrogenase subunit beta, partial [Acidimicrobiia bacterium]|nr:alpha-ketoacid dehydrogenase subunit beta [Acidimicrobiia bacterium]
PPSSLAASLAAAGGAALVGGRPVVDVMFGDFVTLAMDMVVNQAAKTCYMTGGRIGAPVTVRMVTGTAGATAGQHSQSLEAWFVHTPGVKVVAPSTAGDAKALMKAAIRDPDPVMFFEHKLLYGRRDPVPEQLDPLPLGVGRVVREGNDVTVVSYLHTLHAALEAADDLEAEGISVEVLDPRTLVPFDRGLVASSLRKTGRLVVAHEAPGRGGMGAEIAAVAAEEMWDCLRAPVVRVCGTNTPMPYAPELEGFVIPDAGRIADGIRATVDKPAARGRSV